MVTMSPDRTDGKWIPGYQESGEAGNPPTIDEILSLFRESQLYWPSTATAIVNVGTDHVDVNNLAIDIPSSARSRARAERLKKFYQGVWASVKQPVLRTSVRQAFLYGISWLKVMFDPDRWPEAPVLDDYEDEAAYKEALSDFMDRRDIAFTFIVSTVNPRNLVWDDSKTRV